MIQLFWCDIKFIGIRYWMLMEIRSRYESLSIRLSQVRRSCHFELHPSTVFSLHNYTPRCSINGGELKDQSALLLPCSLALSAYIQISPEISIDTIDPVR